MNRQFYNNGSIRMPRRSAVEKNDEYGIDSKGIEECSVCKNVYHDKRWVQSIDDVRAKDPTATAATTVICPACKMISEHLFEGEIIIEHIPASYKADLIGLINNFGTDTMQSDPQDRIIAVEDTGDTVRVTTTENQMAERLSKKINRSMKNSTISISHSADPYEVSRVRIAFTV